MKPLVDKIRAEKKLPLYAVIGATTPIRPYKQNMGAGVGYALREHLEVTGSGTILTGGVRGVGVDVYSGIIKFCNDGYKKAGAEGKTMLDDLFFVLVPHLTIETIFDLEMSNHYEVPEEYYNLAKLFSDHILDVVRAGGSMAERRNYLAQMADILITVNGSGGTLNEALLGIENYKPIIALSYTGGAAATLNCIKNNKIDARLKKELIRNEIDLYGINTGLITVIDSIEELRVFLRNLEV
ncbi:MAG TPA: hypothetical protein VJC39_05630 [Candidatus Nanoarchaeia archaeon]|nr:hypothetical protein [Candidatus Nanoarchaeia archaeon]